MDTHVLSQSGLSAKPVQEWIRSRAAAGSRRLRLDLRSLSLPTSDLLVVLTLAVREASESGVRLSAVGAGPRVRSTIVGLGLGEALELEAERAAGG